LIDIYSDSQIIDLEWLPRINFPSPYKIWHNFEDYADSPGTTKLAFTTHRLHCDHDINCSAYQGFEDKIIKLSEISKYVFTIESELHNYHWKIWEQCHRKNVYWIVPGTVNDVPEMIDNIIIWADWFKTTTAIYKNLPDQLALLKHNIVKPKYFDALLGSRKPHRDFVYNAISSNNLNEKIIATYGGQWDDNKFYAEDYFIWEDGVKPLQKIIGTADYVDYHGHCAHLSQIIPVDVFNQTAYSIIAETDHDNTLSCFTEKTAKPLIAKRLFVAFSGYKFLYNLRRLGFKTFGDVIDESYDLVLDDSARYSMAFEEIKKLCNMDQDLILKKIESIVNYNHDLIMSQDWTRWAADHITDVLKFLETNSAHNLLVSSPG
jgi:hypothetical protein